MKRIAYIGAGGLAAIWVLAMVVAASVWPVINVVETGATPQYPDVQPQYYSTSPERIYEEVVAAVQGLERWEVTAEKPTHYEIGAQRTMAVVGLNSDVKIRVEPVTEFVSQVYLRSASRFWRGDLGQNARNIEEFFEELDRRLGTVKFEMDSVDSESEKVDRLADPG